MRKRGGGCREKDDRKEGENGGERGREDKMGIKGEEEV